MGVELANSALVTKMKPDRLSFGYSTNCEWRLAMPRRSRADKGYLVAKPAGFPGLVIPLLSEEECRARGIEPAKWPPRQTWTQAQRDAANRLGDILRPHVFREALLVILAELERMPGDSELSESEKEQEAARRGGEMIDAGKWKQRDTTIHFPKSWIAKSWRGSP
jgi:hypothetical protein